jgi:hypothetical protein
MNKISKTKQETTTGVHNTTTRTYVLIPSIDYATSKLQIKRLDSQFINPSACSPCLVQAHSQKLPSLFPGTSLDSLAIPKGS